MIVKHIVKEYLEKNGFDGLFNIEGECGCLKEDLCPCYDNTSNCRPGYKTECDCGEHDYHVSEDRPRE